MPATFIGSNAVAIAGGSSASVALPNVQVGDLIVVGASVFFSTGWDASCMDSLGNVYVEDQLDNSAPFSGIAKFYSYATQAGTPTITVTQTAGNTSQHLAVIVANYRNAGVIDQRAYAIGDGGSPHASWTGGFSLSDTLVVSFTYPVVNATISSNTGDVLRAAINATDGNGFAMLDRMATGPGNSNVQIVDGNAWKVSTFTFSKPLPRPGGLVSQYAVRPGAGFQGEVDLWFTKHPLTVSLPYLPAIGSLVIVGSVENVTAAATLSPVVTDAYGNVYTLQVRSVGSGSVVCLFTAIVAHLPPAGEMFQVTYSGVQPGSLNTYQSTALAIAEHILNGAIGAVQTASFLSVTPVGQNNTIATNPIASVPAGAYLFALAAYPGGFTQDSVAWSALEGYTIQQHWDLFQVPGQIPNRAYMSGAAVMDKVAPGTGPYDVQVLATLTGASVAVGGIALLAVTFPPILACPLGSGNAVVGTAYVANLEASGGTPPYTYAIISGSLPPGLSLDPVSGLISGIPTLAGTFNYVAQATDSNGATADTSAGGGCTIVVTKPSGISRGMSILTAKQFSELREKGLRGMPTDIYLDHEFPNAGFHLWPIPSLAHQVEFFYWAVLQQFATVDEALDLPEGYRDALVFNLAVALCQVYRRPVPGSVLALAKNAKKTLQDVNAQILAGSLHSSRTLSGPNEGEIKPAALGPPEPRLLPGAKE